MKKFILFVFASIALHAKYEELFTQPLPAQPIMELADLTEHFNIQLKELSRATISPETALSLLIEHYDVVMIKFSAHWCPPCKAWAPIVTSFAKNNKQITVNDKVLNIAYLAIDIDEYPSIANSYRVSSIPTALYFKEGKLVDRTTGSIAAKELAKKIEAVARK